MATQTIWCLVGTILKQTLCILVVWTVHIVGLAPATCQMYMVIRLLRRQGTAQQYMATVVWRRSCRTRLRYMSIRSWARANAATRSEWKVSVRLCGTAVISAYWPSSPGNVGSRLLSRRGWLRSESRRNKWIMTYTLSKTECIRCRRLYLLKKKYRRSIGCWCGEVVR